MDEIEDLVLKRLAFCRQRYITADEMGDEATKQSLGIKIKKLNLILELL